MDREKSVGFIGLGMMGMPMALNILKAGFPLIAYDIDSQKAENIVKNGAKLSSGPADVARHAKIIVSMVDTTEQAEEVIVGPEGIIKTAQHGDVVISMSTIAPMALREMHNKLSEKGIDLIDAPVSGMEKGARDGTLKAFVGGDHMAIEKSRSVLQAMTAEIIHIGSIGQGTVMKLVNNMLIQVQWVVVAEGLVLGAKAGLDPKTMVDVISNATGNSVAFQYSAPRILSRDFEGIRMDIICKDLELQTDLGKRLKVPLLVGNLAQQIYEMGRAIGLSNEDGGSSIVKVYEQMTDVSLAANPNE